MYSTCVQIPNEIGIIAQDQLIPKCMHFTRELLTGTHHVKDFQFRKILGLDVLCAANNIYMKHCLLSDSDMYLHIFDKTIVV